MSATVLTRSGQQARPMDRGLVPLWSVLAWEIRRLSASRLFWSQAIGLLGFLLLLTWVLRVAGHEAVIQGGRGLQTATRARLSEAKRLDEHLALLSLAPAPMGS